MSGIYIPYLDLPEGEGYALFVTRDGTARVWRHARQSMVGHEYEAIPVPDHGRLKDVDRWTFPTPHRNESNDYMCGWNACLKSIEQNPTIIPSDEGERE